LQIARRNTTIEMALGIYFNNKRTWRHHFNTADMPREEAEKKDSRQQFAGCISH